MGDKVTEGLRVTAPNPTFSLMRLIAQETKGDYREAGLSQEGKSERQHGVSSLRSREVTGNI